VEWENALEYGASRARLSLATLAEQLRGAAGLFEGVTQLIVVFDPTRVDAQLIEDVLVATGGDAGWPAVITYHAVTPGAGYLEYKNDGFAQTGRDIVVFLDLDVIPEPDWLEQILAPFHSPHIAVVTGNTYIDPNGLYARAFALFWFFPPRCREHGLTPTNYIFPNNVAFRREVFARHPFPTGAYFRGKIYEHARLIWRGGQPVLQQMSAHVSHPPPIGIGLFFRRALCQGYDWAILEGEPGYLPPWSSFIGSLRQALRRIGRRRGELQAGWPTAAASAMLALCFYCFVLAGQILGRTRPDVARRYFHI
jgi:hypothetical protein